MASTFLLIWAFGFLVLSAPLLLAALGGDPDEQWHPAVLFLFAAWPLLLLVLLILWPLIELADWYIERSDKP